MLQFASGGVEPYEPNGLLKYYKLSIPLIPAGQLLQLVEPAEEVEPAGQVWQTVSL